MWEIEFTGINGFVKTKYFKNFKTAKKHYDLYENKVHYWFNITLRQI